MRSLETKLGNAVFRNPVFGASGCSGHGYELMGYSDLSKYGALSLKTVTYRARCGNPPERITEVASGILTSVGLQNIGPDRYFKEIVPKSIECLDADQILVSVAGDSVDEYVELCARVAELFKGKIQAVEVNTACPNASLGIGYFSRNAEAATELISKIKANIDIPLIYKFNTNFENYLEVGKAISDAGVDAIYTTNTPLGLKLDIKTKKPILGNVIGPICGPAILPIGVMRVWNLYKVCNVPLIASGGASTWQDVIEYMMAGASAVGVGCAQFANPMVIPEIVAGLESYMEKEKLNSLSEIVGIANKK